jgi:hypothetical protein
LVKSARRTEDNDTDSGSQIVRTFGEVFPDGCVIEPVASATGAQPNLLLSTGNAITIAPQVEHNGRIYQVQELPPSILQATRLPREPVGYGTTHQLFTELAATFDQYLAFSKPAAELNTYWVLSTHFSDCFSSPPALWISGADIAQASDFLGLQHCLCRRALRLTGVTRAGFLSLPMAFRFTLLVLQPSLSRGLQRLLSESNHRGSLIPGNRGTVLDVTSSKAIFVGMDGPAPSPSAGNLHVDLFPPDHEVPLLDERVLNSTADYFLPRLLQYRLDYAQRVRESRFVAPDLRFPTRELARKLGACIQGDAELALQVIPLLRPQDDRVDRCNLDCAILEILLLALHGSATTASAEKMKIEAELTADVNKFLLFCGERRQYSSEEVGIRVSNFELSRKHTNAGTVLLLDRQTSRRVHQLARSYGIDKSVPGCPDCQADQTSVE